MFGLFWWWIYSSLSSPQGVGFKLSAEILEVGRRILPPVWPQEGFKVRITQTGTGRRGGPVLAQLYVVMHCAQVVLVTSCSSCRHWRALPLWRHLRGW